MLPGDRCITLSNFSRDQQHLLQFFNVGWHFVGHTFLTKQQP
jgi:hypothetical protein